MNIVDKIKYINQKIKEKKEEFLLREFPNGRFEGEYFKVGNIHGQPGRSLVINLKYDIGKDFNTGDSFGDYVAMYAKKHNLAQSRAANEIAHYYNIDFSDAILCHTNSLKIECINIEIGLPPPDNIIPTFISFRSDGMQFKKYFLYKNETGYPHFYISRYENSRGEKMFLPFSYSTLHKRWITKKIPGKQSLYNLDLIKKSDSDTSILIVEGEGTAEAASKITSNCVVTTWPFGARSVKNVDWSPLYGKKNIIIWPDNDIPGYEAVKTIQTHLNKFNTFAKIIDIKNKPESWDAGDAEKEGLTFDIIALEFSEDII